MLGMALSLSTGHRLAHLFTLPAPSLLPAGFLTAAGALLESLLPLPLLATLS